MVLSKKRITMALIRLHGCAGWSAPVLFCKAPMTDFLTPRPILKFALWPETASFFLHKFSLKKLWFLFNFCSLYFFGLGAWLFMLSLTLFILMDYPIHIDTILSGSSLFAKVPVYPYPEWKGFKNDFIQMPLWGTGIFLTFWSRGQGPVEFGNKKHLDHQNGKNLMQSKRTGPPF